MKRSLLDDLVCPYCGGAFAISVEVEANEERVMWGLIQCRCFEFPIVDGVLLLSLAKSYGGPEDELNPYVPLLIAAIDYLQAKDVAELRGWIGRHMPEVAPLLSGGPLDTYLTISARLGADIAPLVDRYLAEVSRFEVIGTAPKATGLRDRLRGGRAAPPAVAVDRSLELSRLVDYYTTRFFSPRANALALRMCHLPFEGRVLSLCCGHGVFENFVGALGFTPDLVCLDAQLVNLLVTRRFGRADASFILHDVQFALPFADGAFDGVFSSTCLPEIPSQKGFIEESIHVTAASGWSFFDRTWNVEIGARRIERARHYRFAQNFFATLEDYVALFRESAGAGRDVGIDLPQPSAAYVEDHGWAFGAAADERLATRQKLELSALVIDPHAFKGFASAAPSRTMTAQSISVSPVFDADGVRLTRRTQLAHLDAELGTSFTPFPEAVTLDAARLNDPAYLLEQFTQGLVAFLPEGFDRDTARLADLLS